MGVPRLVLVLVVLLVPAAAGASGHNWDVFFAFSGQNVRGSDDEGSRAKRRGAQSTDVWLAGGHFTVAGTTHRLPRNVSFVADFSSNVIDLGDDGRTDLAQTTLMIGPRWTFNTDIGFLPIVQILPVGFTHNVGGDSLGVPDDAYAMAVGTGIETSRKGAKFGEVGLRAQYDRLVVIGGEDHHRISIGGILRFTEPPEERARKARP